MQIAILDDYQNAALSLAPWNSLPPELRVTSFLDTLREEAAVADRLRPWDHRGHAGADPVSQNTS